MHDCFRSLILVGLVALVACAKEQAPAPVPTPDHSATADFVGSSACANCHATQYSDWTNSHHDLAMQIADATTVLGDFNSARFEYFGNQTEFYKEADRFLVRTANAEGEPQEFHVTHTFGVTPLQQYLVEFPGGKLQALPFAWDTRSQADGGQRWFHLYPDEEIVPGDELHWSGRQQNWNYMCAECHSTNLQVNYDVATDKFATSWSEMNVGCEACHGPASAHVSEAQRGSFSNSLGLQLSLDDHGRAVWQINSQTGIAERSEMALHLTRQPEACGRCHSRRGLISPSYEYGKPLAETHRPALLDAALYHDDGQILDEVYVYGSFVQSRMYRAGVTCSDCHNPHSLQLQTGPEPSAVCTQCHLPQKFAVEDHHKHSTSDVQCVDCHMPEKNYMVVDPRRDHSFRIPRPDLSTVSNAPNACSNCHADQDAAWAARAAKNWWGDQAPNFATVFAAARDGGANSQLHGVIGDLQLPGIVRASALTRLSTPLQQADGTAIQRGLADADPLLRMAALRAARSMPAEAQLQLATPLLRDPLRSVRIEAAWLLSAAHEQLPPGSGFSAAVQEYREAQMAIASRPEAHIALGDLEASMGNPDGAIGHYTTALAMDPGFVPTRLNFADALRRFGDEAGAEALLRDGLASDGDSADLHHSLGLLLVRTERADEGLAELREAARAAPENPRYVYVAGVALHSLGQTDEALALLQQAHERFQQDLDIAWALATMLRDNGDTAGARKIIDEIAAQRPDDPNVAALRDSLNKS
jgi:Flp pilus assembly protein TadD/formate-dependent nitrite reductase cytochrome c552 subunit